MRSGKFSDPAEALDFLCTHHFLPFLPEECHHDSNAFRSTFCYVPNMDAIMRRHKLTLKSLFKLYSQVGEGGVRGMSVREWLELIEHLGLSGIDAKELKQVGEIAT